MSFVIGLLASVFGVSGMAASAMNERHYREHHSMGWNTCLGTTQNRGSSKCAYVAKDEVTRVNHVNMYCLHVTSGHAQFHV